MKIADIETFVVANPPPSLGGRYFMFVKLTSSDGIVGYGEAYAGSVHPDVVVRAMLDVAELTIHETSQMPGDYAKRLSAQELENLLAYLARQTVRPPQARAPQEEK